MMGGADIKKSVAHYFVMNTADFQKNPLHGVLASFLRLVVVLSLIFFPTLKVNLITFFFTLTF